MDRRSEASGLSTLLAALGTAVFLALGSGPASAAAVQSSPCPSTIDVGDRTAELAGFMCGTGTVSVGTPWPISIGITVGHCTGCECGYVFEGSAGSQFTRRGASECGFGAGGGSDAGDQPIAPDGSSDGCQWGKDYIGWEPRQCE